MTRFLLFAASHRPQSHNQKLVNIAGSILTSNTHHAKPVAYESLDMPLYNDHLASTQALPPQAHTLLQLIDDCQGMIIASPEYNWSLPGSLKNIIDWTSKVNINGLKNKTALLLCATPSNRGGIIGLMHLRSALEALQVQVYPKIFSLESSHTGYDDHGNLAAPAKHKQLEKIIDDYVTFTQKLANI